MKLDEQIGTTQRLPKSLTLTTIKSVIEMSMDEMKTEIQPYRSNV